MWLLLLQLLRAPAVPMMVEVIRRRRRPLHPIITTVQRPIHAFCLPILVVVPSLPQQQRRRRHYPLVVFNGPHPIVLLHPLHPLRRPRRAVVAMVALAVVVIMVVVVRAISS